MPINSRPKSIYLKEIMSPLSVRYVLRALKSSSCFVVLLEFASNGGIVDYME